jgi:hypothetical protein
MAVKRFENSRIRQAYVEFANDPVTNVSMWLGECIAMRNALMTQRYLRTLAVALSGSGEGGKRSASGAKERGETYDDAVDKRRAEWQLNQRVERGYAHVCETWVGVNRHRLEAATGGTYIIDNGATLRQMYERESFTRKMHRRLERLEDTRFAKTGTSTRGSGNATVADGDDDDDDDDETATDEMFELDEDANADETPALHVTLTDRGIMQLSLSLSAEMHSQAMQRRVKDDCTSTSPLLFRCTAACIGPNLWLVLDTCPWRHKVIECLWDSDVGASAEGADTPMSSTSGDVVALFVDGICFTKRRPVPCGLHTDPYVCTRCGAIRRENNLVYATRHGDLKRGKYQCAVCERPTIHISQDKRGAELRKPWSTAPPKQRQPDVRLNRFPFDG